MLLVDLGNHEENAVPANRHIEDTALRIARGGIDVKGEFHLQRIERLAHALKVELEHVGKVVEVLVGENRILNRGKNRQNLRESLRAQLWRG